MPDLPCQHIYARLFIEVRVIATTSYYASTISVDATSSIELGTAGSAAKGALTIDSGVTAVLAGVINGNVVVNGTLGVVGLGYGPSGSSATSLAISAFGTAAPSISPSFRLANTTNH